MQIIISPAKKMKEDIDSFACRDLLALLPRTRVLLRHLRGLDVPSLRKLLSCNDQIAELNYARFQTMDLERDLTPALLAYEGIQYRYMAPAVFTSDALEYVQEHLRILSGFYGVLRPFDGVRPYRLEMQAKLKTDFCASLYDFWGEDLARLLDGEGVLLNLASAEYSRSVLPHLPPGIRVITPIFGERNGAEHLASECHDDPLSHEDDAECEQQSRILQQPVEGRVVGSERLGVEQVPPLYHYECREEYCESLDTDAVRT